MGIARLVLRSGVAVDGAFPLADGLNRIGRAAGNEVRIEGPTVSATHCEIWLMRERMLVRDLGSTNGTFVDGRPVTESELAPGNILSVGGLEFVVEGGGGSTVPASGAVGSAPGNPVPPRFTAEGAPCCANHAEVAADYRCPKCGEQFCRGCVRVLGRRGGRQHAYCPMCHAECVAVLPGRGGGASGAGRGGWLAKLTQTLKLGRM